MGNAFQVHVGCLGETRDMLLQAHAVVKNNIVYICGMCGIPNNIIEVRGEDYYELCFVGIEFKKIILHPSCKQLVSESMSLT